MLFKVTWYSFFLSRETNKHETDAVSDMDFNPGILKVRVLSRERRQKMSKIQKINKQTENRFLNLYDLEAKRPDGRRYPLLCFIQSENTE